MIPYRAEPMAERLGVEVVTLHAWLSGHRQPRKATAVAWALILNLPEHAFWDVEAERQAKEARRSA